MDYKDWLLIRALDESGSITRAAAELFVSQPALSKRIRQLEDEFHIQLVVRSSTGVTLTDAGRRLADYAGEMLQRYHHIKGELEALRQNGRTESIRIGVPNMFSQLVLPPILKAFSLRYPEINPSTRSGFSTDIVQWLRADEVQIAFLRGDREEERYQRYLISRDPICIVSRDPLDLNELSRRPRITYQTDPSLHSQLDVWWDQCYAPQKMQIGMQVGDSQTCIHLVGQGIGYALVPYYVISAQARETLWIEPLHDAGGEPILRPTWMVYLEKDLGLRPIRLFVEFIKEFFPGSDEAGGK